MSEHPGVTSREAAERLANLARAGITYTPIPNPNIPKSFTVRHGDNRTVANKLRQWADAIESSDRACGMAVLGVDETESGQMITIRIFTPAATINP